jgi:hypothetical protein
MRRAYLGGAPMVSASALLWAGCAALANAFSPQSAALVLFVCMLLVHPAGAVLARLLGRSGRFATGHPLGLLLLQSSWVLLLCMSAAYMLSVGRLDLFFAIMCLAACVRYLMFAKVFGSHAYVWLSGGLTMVAFVTMLADSSVAAIAAAAAAVEFAFALIIFTLAYREQ